MVRMAEFLSSDAVRFEIQDGAPVVHLAVGPPPAVRSGAWSLLSLGTVCVIDGPDQAGFLVPRCRPDGTATTPDGWDSAVERAAGSHVVFGAGLDAASIFVPVADR
jgi:hypothetical protein